MHFRCTFAPACDAAASRLRIASCLSPLPVLPFCGRRPPSEIEYPEMICYTCIDTIRISDADQSVFAEVPSMNDSRDFKKEYDVFLQKVPYQTAVIAGIKVRYQYGGVYAQIFAKRHPGSVSAMILTTTLTVDSDYVRDIRKERFSTPVFLLLLKLVPAKTERTIRLSKNGILRICGEKYRFSFRKKICSKKRIRTALRRCSESWMRRFSMFRADTQALSFRQSAIWIGWKRFWRNMDPSDDLCEKKGCLMRKCAANQAIKKNGAPEGAPFCIRFRDGRRVAFLRSAGSGGSGPPKRPLPPAAAAPEAAGQGRLPR